VGVVLMVVRRRRRDGLGLRLSLRLVLCRMEVVGVRARRGKGRQRIQLIGRRIRQSEEALLDWIHIFSPLFGSASKMLMPLLDATRSRLIS
jgi:hypothetical protein